MSCRLPWLLMLLPGVAMAQTPGRDVGLIQVDGAIGPATATYISRAIDLSGERAYQALIIELDTPGGLLSSTQEIIKRIYASPVPVVVYVAPTGANAASAGCFITMAAHVAAMAPNTSIGAAHPVTSGGLTGSSEADGVMKEKLENFAVSYIEAIAEKRGRNVAWAKSSVRESASITAEAALATNAIDIIAKGVPDLLRQLDGRTVDQFTLHTVGATVVSIPMTLRERTFQMLWRPEVMFVLMLIAIYGIIGEMSNPGAVLPGVVGAIALILALYMATILPIRIAGVALIALSVALFVTDAFAPTHGVLTAGGIASFFVGALMLFDSPLPAFQLSLRFIIPATLITTAFFIFVVGAGLKAQFLPVRVGGDTMIGKVVEAVTAIDGQSGRVFAEGTYWSAISAVPVEQGHPVEITAIRGLTLTVKPIQPGDNHGQHTTAD